MAGLGLVMVRRVVVLDPGLYVAGCQYRGSPKTIADRRQLLVAVPPCTLEFFVKGFELGGA